MDQRAIEDLIIELLAEEAGAIPAVLRTQLEERGDEMPVDSVQAVEVVTKVEARCGIEIPASAETARCLRSVGLFAQMVSRLVAETGHGRAAGDSA